MALGVEKAWGKEFADITMEPPQWYNDTTMSSNIFNSTNFIHSLSSFGTAMRASGTSPSHAGGGGGFSGGGGGGGGGGSW